MEGPQDLLQRGSFRAGHSTQDPSDQFEWDIYKRYSNFVALHDLLLPYIRSLGVDAPALPPQVNVAESSSMNQALTKRKFDLQKYLVQILVLLSDRFPLPLMQFLHL
jgi:hypothetical protein